MTAYIQDGIPGLTRGQVSKNLNHQSPCGICVLKDYLSWHIQLTTNKCLLYRHNKQPLRQDVSFRRHLLRHAGLCGPRSIGALRPPLFGNLGCVTFLRIVYAPNPAVGSQKRG